MVLALLVVTVVMLNNHHGKALLKFLEQQEATFLKLLASLLLFLQQRKLWWHVKLVPVLRLLRLSGFLRLLRLKLKVLMKQMFERKKDELQLLTRRIKQLNKDNLRKDQEIQNVDE